MSPERSHALPGANRRLAFRLAAFITVYVVLTICFILVT